MLVSCPAFPPFVAANQRSCSTDGAYGVLITTLDDGNDTIPRLEEILRRGGHDRARDRQGAEIIGVMMDGHLQFVINSDSESGLGSLLKMFT